MKNSITTVNAPQAIGPYSQAIQLGSITYFSGQIPLNPHTMLLVSTDFKLQAEQVFKNLQAVCVAAGGDLENIVKITVYLMDLANFASLNEVMLSFFKAPFPARTTIQVAGLPKAALIEVEAVMMLGQ